jgi:SAM-dependent methyltransferase
VDLGPSPSCEFRAADMRDLPAGAGLDGAFCFGNSFAYLDDAGNAVFLRAVAGALRPGARFALEAPLVAETLAAAVVGNSWHQLGDILFLRRAELDHRAGRLEVEYTLLRGAEREVKWASYRIYTFRELLALLEGAGFGPVEDFGSLSGEPFAFGARGLYLVATRG